MKALANKRRLAILRFIRNEKEASVGNIADQIKLSFNATSKHLGVLSSANILDKEQRSLQMFYRLGDNLPEVINRIISIL